MLEDNKFLNIEEKELRRIYSFAYESLYSHGILKKEKNGIKHIKTTLFPSHVSKGLFKDAREMQTAMNSLLYLVTKDVELLKKIHAPIAKEDKFIEKILEICEKVEYNKDEKIVIGLYRTDYMIDDKEEKALKLVEMNLMASSYGGIMQRVREYHLEIRNALNIEDVHLPECRSASSFAQALICGVESYSFLHKTSAKPEERKVKIAMIVDQFDSNEFDQRHLESEVYKLSQNIQMVRVNFEYLRKNPEKWQVKEDGRLFIDDDEIGVVYFRSGYSPAHYKNEESWEIRLKIEKSSSVKIPTITQMLVNTKITQAALAKREIFDKYQFSSPEIRERIWMTFGKQYALSPDFGLQTEEEITQVIEKAIQHPDLFVLKPQREGGGNNFFNNEIVEKLKNSSRESLRSYVLMEKYNPYKSLNYIVDEPIKAITCSAEDETDTLPAAVTIVGELGIYGTYCRVNDDVVINNSEGHLLRSKVHGVDEGGITTGFACLDSPSFLLQ